MGLNLHGNYKYCFSLSQQTNATLPHPSYTATGVYLDYNFKKYCGQNNLFIVKFILKFIIHFLKLIQKKCFTSNLMRMEHGNFLDDPVSMPCGGELDIFHSFVSRLALGFTHHHQCSVQGQVLHCTLRHQGCNSAQRQVFHYKLRNLGCCLTRDEQVRQPPVAHLSKNEYRNVPGCKDRRAQGQPDCGFKYVDPHPPWAFMVFNGDNFTFLHIKTN